MHPQLTLALDTAPTTSFDSFHVDTANDVVRNSVRAFVQGDIADEQVFLWGETGTGKSHLLAAACQVFSRRGYRVAYLPGELVNYREALEGMEYCDLLCIDDLQRLDHASEMDLFYCINRCREEGTKLIFAADRPPEELGLKLMDLQTRLAWGLIFHIQPLGEEVLATALRKEIEVRSLQASEDVLSYIMRRFPRRISTLKHVVDTLDNVSLSEQRRITIPFVKSVFGEAERAVLADRIR